MSKLNLEIARQARKEENFELSEHFLKKTLYGNRISLVQKLEDELDLICFRYYKMSRAKLQIIKVFKNLLSIFRTSSFSNGQLSCLRQCAKLNNTVNKESKKDLPVELLAGIVYYTCSLNNSDYEKSEFVALKETGSRALQNLVRLFKVSINY